MARVQIPYIPVAASPRFIGVEVEQRSLSQGVANGISL